MSRSIAFLLLLGSLFMSFTHAADYAVGDRLGPKADDKARHPNEVSWNDLLPKGWDPVKELEAMDLSSLQDADPAASAALEKITKMWNEAPVNQAMGGREVRLAGFTVPLEFTDTTLKEFLLVPYFGACIHVPPPPANQIVHVVLERAVPLDDVGEAVWVEGVLELVRLESDMAQAGYRIKARKIEDHDGAR